MITFRKTDSELIFTYEPDLGEVDWVHDRIRKRGKIKFKDVFHFLKTDFIQPEVPVSDEPSEYAEFHFGTLVTDYYKIDGRYLGIDRNLFVSVNIDITETFFSAGKRVSIFSAINSLVREDIYIGGNHPNSISLETFKAILKQFPNYHELRKYVHARLSTIIGNHFNTAIDAEAKYHSYMNRKVSRQGKNLLNELSEFELRKYELILEKLEEMLRNEHAYNEHQWQTEILQIIRLLYPKYILAFSEVAVFDDYYNKNRSLDYLLVDSSGHVDIVEIKRPFDNKIVSQQSYRDNFIPLRELSGTIMQIEKYIFNLNRWGKKGEAYLTARYHNDIPAGFQIKITNPSGLIIMGREVGLTPDQKRDFEVIKRKYKNVIDILTYDDLLQRLRFTIEQLKMPLHTQSPSFNKKTTSSVDNPELF